MSESFIVPIDHMQTLFQQNGRFIRIVEDAFACSVEIAMGTDAVSVDLKTQNHNAVISALKAIDTMSEKEELSEQWVNYICMLGKENRISDFLAMSSSPILITPNGRSIRTKTLGQRLYVDALSHHELVICNGPAGSGKTFLGVAMAVLALRNKEVSRIILTRPAVEAGERLGFLPGDIEEKVDPYMRPIFDALLELLGREAFEKYYDKGVIEVSPLAFMRGRNLDDSFILLDEAQNTTIEQMKMFLTRIGMNSRACVCGDDTQIDLPRGIRNGLLDAMEILKDVPSIACVSLNETDIVRNPLVQKIIMAYNAREREDRV